MPQLTEAQKKIQSKLIPGWVDRLKKNNVPSNVIPLLISQIILESNWFTSNAYLKDNNPAGITWNKNYLKRPGASIGIKRPSVESGNYVHFENLDFAVIDYLRVISQNGVLGKPIDSTNYIEYAKRLKANKYYTSPLDDYIGGMKAQLTRIYKWFDIEALLKKKTSFKIISGLVSVVILLYIFRKKF